MSGTKQRLLGKLAIKHLALDTGFKLKEQPNGDMDLNPYVYDFADELILTTISSIERLLKDRQRELASTGVGRKTELVLDVYSEGIEDAINTIKLIGQVNNQ
ncbi:hypothetical protein ACFBZI_10605 [Moraxella sp. ZJ142]|uniref:hypothetical protein n=1 Tax=Moraxella marmotae TaxID=3344520 RepID=UPI0035D4E10F